MRRPFFALASLLVALPVLAACGSSGTSPTDGGGGGDDGGGGGGDGGNPTWDGGVPPPPPATCDVPAKLVDTSSPTGTVGDGTPGSCTENALRAAVAAGGTVVFSCGAAPITITLTSPLTPPKDKDTVIDGGGKVTLSGGGTTRILELVHSFEKASPTVTVQRLAFTKGRTTDVPNTTATTKGGAAMYTLGGNLTAIDCTFTDNHGPDTGQDVAGGAIYNVGAGATVVVGSTFAGNTCSNGGAVGALGSSLTIVNSSLSDNATTGSGGNPGNGGNGGGAVMDGKGKTLTICGAVFSSNKANAFGGAVFRTSYENEATNIDRSVFDGNQVADVASSQAGALYLQGTKITLTNSTIVRNKARLAGGVSVYEHGQPAPGQIDMTNVTIADNATWERMDFTMRGLVGGITVGDRVLGTWKNVTIAGNAAQFASGIGGTSNRLTITNSLVANDAQNLYTPLNCNGTGAAGTKNLQWPEQNKAMNDIACVVGITRADPKLGALEGMDGQQKVRRPQVGSPAIGLGADCPPTDQLGKPRAAQGCAAGAVEP